MPDLLIKTLVIGASDNPGRYSFRAIQRLRASGHPVLAIGSRLTQVGDVSIGIDKPAFTGIDTVTLYIGASLQKEYYEYILSLRPRRVIFNPGAENIELEQLVEASGIQAEEACTLVMLSTGQY